MATYINTKDALGEQATLDALVAHTLTDFTDSDITEIGALGAPVFFGQSQIENITLPNLTKINGSYAFQDCSNLKKLRIGLEKRTVCPLTSTVIFKNTGRSIIFVPPDLVSNYRSASNWSAFASRIYGDGDTSAPVWDESEITDTDSELFARIQNGTAASYYKLGQYKSVNFGTLGTLRMQIIGINADELADGTGTAQLTWFPMELPSSKHGMNPSNSNNEEGTGSIGGWDKSEMKSYLYNDVWPLIPSEWRDVIKEVKKYSRIFNTSGQAENNVLTNEKIWLLSTREVNGSTNHETLGPCYNFAFVDQNSRIRKVGSSAFNWWLRSASSASNFAYVNFNGSWNDYYASSSFGVGFGYCT